MGRMADWHIGIFSIACIITHAAEAYRPASASSGNCEAAQDVSRLVLKRLQHHFLCGRRLFRFVLGRAMLGTVDSPGVPGRAG